jgi:hypothetical protein
LLEHLEETIPLHLRTRRHSISDHSRQLIPSIASVIYAT